MILLFENDLRFADDTELITSDTQAFENMLEQLNK